MSVERAFTDACDEIGCAYDNEALLTAIAELKARSLTIEAETREACAVILDEVAWLLNVQSTNATTAGDNPSMYRINTAWHAITNAATAIRAAGKEQP